MGINFHAQYGFVLLGCIEIFIGVFLFTASYLIDKYDLRNIKMSEVRTFFKKLHISKKSLLLVVVAIFVLCLLIFIQYLDLPESQSLKNTLTWPLVILGASAFSYNSLIDSKRTSDKKKKSAVIEHLMIKKVLYKNMISAIFCGVFIVVGIKTILLNN